MQTLTYFFVLPPLVFAIVSLLWVVNRTLIRPLALLPVLCCYLIGGFILIAGGCNRVAHVRLEGVEADLVARDGSPRELSIGGQVRKGEAPFLEVPDYPADALRLGLAEKDLRLRPGPGFENTILVRSGPGLIPLRDGLPATIPLMSGDRIQIGRSAGGATIRQWILGPDDDHLSPPSGDQWRGVGSAGAGVAKLPGLPAEIFRLRLEERELVFRAGPGFSPEFSILVDGKGVDFSKPGENRVVYRPGETRLAIVRPEPLEGVIDVRQGSFLNHRIALGWESKTVGDPRNRAVPFLLKADESLSIGGTVRDDIFVKGLPAGSALLTASGDRTLELALTDAGRLAQRRGELDGNYPQESKEGSSCRLGEKESPWGGTFQLVQAIESEPQTPSTESADPDENAGDSGIPEGDEVSGELPSEAGAAPPAPEFSLRVVWIPNGRTLWTLPNRQITFPLMNVSFGVFTRRPWEQRVYPLNRAGPFESGLRSCVVYGPDHPEINGSNLLMMDRNLAVERGGKELPPVSRSRPDGLLNRNSPITFLQLVTRMEEGANPGAAASRAVTEISRVALKETFASLRLKAKRKGQKDIPVVEVRYFKPEVQSIPMREIYRDVKASGAKERKVAFGVNEPKGFSNLPHQVRFRSVTDWFGRANAEISLNAFSLDVQDDYRRQKVDYGEPFTVGGDRRLQLRVIKQTVPWKAIFAVLGAGGLMLILGWSLVRSYSWAALLFGIAFLTVTRVLFGQAALVNPPYNEEVLRLAIGTLFGVPLAVAGGGLILRVLLPGKVDRWLTRFDEGFGYRTLIIWTVLLLLLRVVLLLGGLKESVDLGFRFAFSIVFVPAYLILFSLGCARLFTERSEAGEYRLDIVGRFGLFALVISLAQGVSGLLVSDLGLFLYLIPQGVVLALIGIGIVIESVVNWLRSPRRGEGLGSGLAGGAGLLLLAPLTAILLVFFAPKSVVNAIPDLRQKLESETDIATGSTLLRILQFVDEDYLINLGTDAAERIAQDHAITENYARRGFDGEGYLRVNVIPAKRVTALNDTVSAVFIFGQFGVLGALGVAAAYLAVTLGAVAGGLRMSGAVGWAGVMAGMSFSIISIYMMASNYGLLPFTGRNMYLLGLDSLGADVMESLILLSMVVVALTRSEFSVPDPAARNAARTDPDRVELPAD